MAFQCEKEKEGERERERKVGNMHKYIAHITYIACMQSVCVCVSMCTCMGICICIYVLHLRNCGELWGHMTNKGAATEKRASQGEIRDGSPGDHMNLKRVYGSYTRIGIEYKISNFGVHLIPQGERW